MAKSKRPVKSKDDTKVASIVLGLFVAFIIIFFIVSKGKESSQELPPESHKANVKEYHQEVHKQYYKAPIPVVHEGVDTYIPNESMRPVESISSEIAAPPEPIPNIPGSGGKIAFILDDWGQTTANCKYLKQIPEPMAVSILPGLRHTKDVANCAKSYHKLTMLHLPLEALHNYDFYPPNYIIKTSMHPELVSKIVDGDLAQLPSIEGVNNHMGSKATESSYLMSIILTDLKRRGLFFVDSMTAHNTVCGGIADQIGLAFAKRDVFLDNVNTRDAITRQIIVLAKEARHRGYAIAIGHDRHLTMQVLKDEIPLLEAQGFQIVSIKSLLKNK